MLYSPPAAMAVAPNYSIPIIPSSGSDAISRGSRAELFPVESKSRWMTYDVDPNPVRRIELRFADRRHEETEKASRSAIGAATALVLGASGCSGVVDEKTGELDPFPILGALLLSIVTFMLGVWVGRSLGKDAETTDSTTAKGNNEAEALPELVFVDEVGREEAETIPEGLVAAADEEPEAEKARLDIFAPFAGIDTSDLSADESKFFSAWVSYAGIFHAQGIGPAVKPKLSFIIRSAIGGYYSKLNRDNPNLSDGFFRVLEQLAKRYAAMEQGRGEPGIEIVERHALFSALLSEAKIISDPRIDVALVALAEMKSRAPIVEHAFVEDKDGKSGLKDSAKTPEFARAAARLMQNQRIWRGEFGGMLMSNIAETSSFVAELDPFSARQMRFAALINMMYLPYEWRRMVKERIMSTFDPAADKDWLTQIASGQWPVPHPDAAADMARLILDTFQMEISAKDWSSLK